MPQQLSLFGEENTLFNAGIQRLLEMDFARCLETFQRYKKLFPGEGDVSHLLEIATFFWKELGQGIWTRIDPIEAERRYQIWEKFEAVFGHPWRKDSIEDKLQVRYFSMLAEGMLAEAHSTIRGIPVALMYLLARRPDEAIISLRSLIKAEPENARAYGYLGDAHFLKGEVRTARLYYRQAFAMAALQVDIRRLQDRELKERIEELEGDEQFDEDSLEWFPVLARLEGIFECHVFKDLDELKHWHKRYLDLFKNSHKKDQMLVPQFFYHAMVLSDNVRRMKYIRGIDLAEIRQQMKDWQPDFFARYMKVLEVEK